MEGLLKAKWVSSITRHANQSQAMLMQVIDIAMIKATAGRSSR
jgi:hypothetical protein